MSQTECTTQLELLEIGRLRQHWPDATIHVRVERSGIGLAGAAASGLRRDVVHWFKLHKAGKAVMLLAGLAGLDHGFGRPRAGGSHLSDATPSDTTPCAGVPLGLSASDAQAGKWDSTQVAAW